MTTYYLDTSALIKRYVDEVGSRWLRATLNGKPRPAMITVHLVIVEVTSALMRRVREGVLTDAEYVQVQNAFRADCLRQYELVTAVDDVIDQANRLLETYSLRAYDAVHLATAVVSNRHLLANDLAPLAFLSADDRLNQAASAEGLTVDNPNTHP
ncbi:type II toxin-antitoxin system VapC family toxin [Candidatus Amarolinea aalborgensis]|uniref:type II toxin-antitoxin system VapC family toxin n=1 Tax=Candidatus Amarolinea aalborgensis TaxID=2249329 RepID=UPI003BFA0A8D